MITSGSNSYKKAHRSCLCKGANKKAFDKKEKKQGVKQRNVRETRKQRSSDWAKACNELRFGLHHPLPRRSK
jgi:hypothetical protein